MNPRRFLYGVESVLVRFVSRRQCLEILFLSPKLPFYIKTTNTYDAKGNLTQTLNRESASDPAIGVKTGYDAKGNYATSATDARGYSVTKVVNETTGLTASVTDPASTTVNYTYDASKRVTDVSCTTDSKTYKNAYTYTNDRIATVSHNTTTDTPDVTYTFGYDALGRKTSVKVGNQTLSTNIYATDRSSLLKEVQYGNTGKAKYAYDDFDRLVSVTHDAATTPRFTHEYGANGKVARVTDHGAPLSTEIYEYDLAERPMQYTRRDTSGTIIYQTTVKYDKVNQLKTFREYVNGAQEYKTSYFYDKDGRTIREEYLDNSHKVEYSYDAVGRVVSRKVTNGTNVRTSTYVFEGGSTSLYGANATTPLVKEIQQTGMNLSYTYDSRGNITGETRNNATTNYFYDGMGQLIRVNDPHEGATWRYEYDRGGNMTKTRKYAYTTASEPGTTPVDTVLTYSATWKDQLVKFGDRNLTYDPIGNMLTDGVHANTWEYGRQLRRTELTSGEHKGIIYRYAYNKDGLRTVKRRVEDGNSIYTYYTYSGNRVTHYSGNGYVMHFFYDAQGRVSMARFWNGTESKYYTYVYNLQGDVVGLVNDAGTLVVEYKYDAWGKPYAPTGDLKDSFGKANPFRYRGYVYDEEMEYYYLRSRYYDPKLRRFINADDSSHMDETLLSCNLYAYCKNNPVTMEDVDGNWSWPSLGRLLTAVVAVALVATVIVMAVATAGAALPVAGSVAYATGTSMAAAIGAGGIAGIAGKYVEDVVYNASQGVSFEESLVPSSSIEDYASSALNGCMSGAVGLVAPKIYEPVTQLIDSAMKPALRDSLEYASGRVEVIDTKKQVTDIVTRYGTSFMKGKTIFKGDILVVPPPQKRR